MLEHRRWYNVIDASLVMLMWILHMSAQAANEVSGLSCIVVIRIYCVDTMRLISRLSAMEKGHLRNQRKADDGVRILMLFLLSADETQRICTIEDRIGRVIVRFISLSLSSYTSRCFRRREGTVVVRICKSTTEPHPVSRIGGSGCARRISRRSDAMWIRDEVRHTCVSIYHVCNRTISCNVEVDVMSSVIAYANREMDTQIRIDNLMRMHSNKYPLSWYECKSEKQLRAMHSSMLSRWASKLG